MVNRRCFVCNTASYAYPAGSRFEMAFRLRGTIRTSVIRWAIKAV